MPRIFVFHGGGGLSVGPVEIDVGLLPRPAFHVGWDRFAVGWAWGFGWWVWFGKGGF